MRKMYNRLAALLPVLFLFMAALTAQSYRPDVTSAVSDTYNYTSLVNGKSSYTRSYSSGSALHFDGADNFILVSNDAPYQLNNGTVEAWIRPTSAGGYRGVVVKVFAFGMYLVDDVIGVYDYAANATITGGSSLADGNWHHVAFVFQNGVANGSKLYVDGVLVITFTYTIANQGTALVLGAGNVDGSDQLFGGDMDEIRIWNSVRSDCDIAAYDNCEIDPATPGLVAYYKFNQGAPGGNNTSIANLTNSVAGGVNGTLNGFTLNGSTSNFIEPGGVSSGITCSSPLALFSVTGSGSFCAGGVGLPVSLSGSESGVNYQLFKNGASTGSPIAGTGSALDFGTQTDFATYTVLGTDGGGCSGGMNGSAILTEETKELPVPSASPTNICSAATANLSASASAGTIDWYDAATGGTLLGSSALGANFPVSPTATTTYYAQINPGGASGCFSTTRAAVIVSVSPVLYAVTGGGFYCTGSTDVPIGLSGSQTGVSYQLKKDNVDEGSPLAGTGDALEFAINAAGTYTVVATFTAGGCTETMAGSAVFTEATPPIATISSANLVTGEPLTVNLNSGTISKIEWKNNGTTAFNVPYFAEYGVVVAGGNGRGYDLNQLHSPKGTFVDSDGNLYVADVITGFITKWAPGATEGVVIAQIPGSFGSGLPVDVFVDADDNVYVAEFDNYQVTKWAPGASSGVVVAGGNGEGSALNQVFPNSIWVDTNGDIYIADVLQERVMKWAPGATEGIIVAGGNGSGSALNQLRGVGKIALDTNKNIYVADGNYRVVKWTPGATQGVIVAGGNGQGFRLNQLDSGLDVDVDAEGNIYVADYYNDRIVKWAPGATEGILVAGIGGRGNGLNQLNDPGCVTVGPDGNLYVSDSDNWRVLRFDKIIENTYTPTLCGKWTAFVTDNNGCTALSNELDLVSRWYADTDSDGFIDPNNFTDACPQPSGYLPFSAVSDCDDTNALVNPSADEICGDWIDNNCDGISPNSIFQEPVISPVANLCQGETVTLTATSPTGQIEWYDTPTGGTPVGVGPTFDLTLASSTVLYAQENDHQYSAIESIDVSTALAIINTDPLTGDDGRGLAVTKDYVFYTGDNRTVRYDHNLQNGFQFPIRLDGMFSNLHTGKLYGFQNETGWSESNFDRFQEYSHGGVPIGAPVMLSQAFSDLPDNVMICSGFGYVLVYTSSATSTPSGFFRIDLPSGQVTLINSTIYPTDHRKAESGWAWYTAEYDGTDYAIVYRQITNNLLRRINLTTGLISDVVGLSGSVTNSDAGQFVFSPWDGRLFFHNENSNGYNGGSSGEWLTALAAPNTLLCIGAPRSSVTIALQVETTGATICTGGTGSLTATSACTLSLPEPGTIEWYTTASGGSSIFTGSPFNPVGVADSGLTDTNTPGTITYYAACSGNPTCRTAANFVIFGSPTASVTTLPTCLSPTGGAITVTLPSPAPGVSYTLTAPGVVPVNNTTGVFTGLTSGVYSVTSVAEGCLPSLPTSLTVSSPDLVTTVGATICVGEVASLTSNTVCNPLVLNPIILSDIPPFGAPTYIRSSSSSSTYQAFGLVAYTTITVAPTVTGSYTLTGCCSVDGHMQLYTNAFDPNTPSNNFLAADDDANPAAGICANDPKLTVNLTAGVPLIIVFSRFFGTEGASEISVEVAPPAGGGLIVPTPLTLDWYKTATGGTPIGSGSPFNPVGVADSGLPDTNTPGTYTFYAACSNTPTCRTPTNIVINQNGAPSVSITANPGSSITASTVVTFTATPVNGGTTPSYQWMVNGNPVGTNSPTYMSSTLADGDEVTVEMTSSNPCALPATATSNALVLTVCSSPIRYVKAVATGDGSGESWDNASDNLQAMIDSPCATEIWVAAGTYLPERDPFGNATPTDPRNKTFYLKDGIAIYGGFAGTETDRSQRNPSTNVTILSGDIGTPNDPSDNCYHVAITVFDGANTVLDGFTITKGTTAPSYSFVWVEQARVARNSGAALQIIESAITLNNCIIEGNAGVYGGGLEIYMYEVAPVISRCRFTNNKNLGSAPEGSGMYLYADGNAEISFTDCEFSSNTGGVYGGAAYLYLDASAHNINFIGCTFAGNAANNGGAVYTYTSGTNQIGFTNCTFTGNTATLGGAVYQDEGTNSDAFTFTNSLFVGNQSTDKGGALYLNAGISTIINSTIYGNSTTSTTENSGAIYAPNGLTVVNSILWDNTSAAGGPTHQIDFVSTTPNVTYSTVQGTPLFAGTGNINADPLFTDAANGDYTLQGCSPAINAGSNAAISLPTDLAGDARIQNTTVDMGAYENITSSGIITAIAVANASDCDGQNTTCTTDDTFTADVTVTFTSIPASGNLSLTGPTIEGTVPPVSVDDIGTTSYTFTSVTLKADGGDIDLTATFSEGCDYTNTQETKAPSCGGSQYTPTNITVSGFVDCPLVDGEYVPTGTYNGAPQWAYSFFFDDGGIPTITTEFIRWTGSAWEFYNEVFTSQDAVNATGSISELPCTGWIGGFCGTPTLSGGCGNLSGSTGPSCDITNISIDNASGCNDNGTTDADDDYFTADVTVTYQYAPEFYDLILEQGGEIVAYGDGDYLCNTEYTFENVQLPANGAAIILTAIFAQTSRPSGQANLTGGVCSFTSESLGTAPESCSCVPPTFTACPTNKTAFTSANACTAVVDYVATADGSPASEITYTFTGFTTGTGTGTGSGTIFNKGVTTVTLTATNDCGAPTCQFTVTVTDNVKPVITCPANRTVNADQDLCSSVQTYNVVTTDNCSASTTQTSGLSSGTAFPVGNTTNGFTATDDAGNTSTCAFTITVLDNQKPVITCPDNRTVNADQGQCSSVQSYTVTTTDNCSATTQPTAGLSSGAAFPVGITINAFLATDAAGNTAICSFSIRVLDTQLPVVTCPANTTLGIGDNCSTPLATYGLANKSDNCSTAIFETQSPVAGTIVTGHNTAQTVTLTATDASGNTASCSFVVTLKDVLAPSITCPANIIRPTDPSLCSAVVTYATPIYSDNCSGGGAVHINGGTSGATFPKGISTVNWQATDGVGLTKTCSFTVTVNDAQAPTITCPANIVRNNDAGQCSAVVTYPTPKAADNCGLPAGQPQWVSGGTTPTASGANSVATFQKGANIVTWRATDGAGLTKTCTFRVTVNDIESPTLTCPAPMSLTTAPNTCSSVAATYTNPTFTDNCALTNSTATRINGLVSGSTFPLGNNNVVFQATDAAGNTRRCTMVVTVTDNQPPVITCPAAVVATGTGTPCISTVFYGSTTASDNCAGTLTPFLVTGLASGSIFPVGVITNTFRAVAPNGQSSECSFSVTVDCGSGIGNNGVEVRNTNLNIQYGDKLELKLAPNPALSTVTVSIEGVGANGGTLLVFDAVGRLVLRQVIAENQQTAVFQLEGSEFAPGMYRVNLRTEHGMVTKTLVVVK